MKNRFKLTTGFLIISTAIFVVAAMVITRSATHNEEANLVRVVSEQSGRDAQVIAGVVTGYLMDDGASNSTFAAPETSGSHFGSLALSTFLQSSNIVRLSLYDVTGEVLWSSDADVVSQSVESDAFAGAIQGSTLTTLNRGVDYTSITGEAGTGDLTSTFLPLVDSSTQRPVQILEVSRDVTGTLTSRIDHARSSMFKTIFGTLGGSFVILFGVVLTADVLIGRSRARAVSHERALADEKIFAHRLELENQQLRQMNEERDRFLSMVSHELRTPLTTILGFTDVLRRRQEGESKEKNLKHLDLMRRNGEHLNALIEEMLEITRIEAGKFEIVKDVFPVELLVEQLRASASVILNSRSQRLQIKNAVDGLEMHADRRRIVQVMLNLLTNASNYSPRDTTVYVEMTSDSGSLFLKVKDEGVGIPEEERYLLFDRFYRRDDSNTRAQSGLGLGLSIVKAIVDAHEGTVEIDSEAGYGSVITVVLPGVTKAGGEQAVNGSGQPMLEGVRGFERAS